MNQSEHARDRRTNPCDETITIAEGAGDMCALRRATTVRARTGTPRCDSSEPALPIDSARNQALAAEHLAYVVDVGVRVGQDEVAGLQRVDGQRLAGLTYLGEQGGECGPERPVIAGVDRAGQLVVKGVELGDGFVVQLVLAFGEDSDDHLPSPSSSLRGSAAPSSCFIFAS